MLKFRVFDKRYNTYLSPIKVGNMLWDALNSKDYILEQFTGLQDKNGVDIYVGDILSNEYDYFKVYFDEELAQFRIATKKYSLELNKINDELDFEIIGNINENKELLENEYIF